MPKDDCTLYPRHVATRVSIEVHEQLSSIAKSKTPKCTVSDLIRLAIDDWLAIQKEKTAQK